MTRGPVDGPPSPIALIPAAGHARRMGAIPSSKEILPVGWSAGGGAGTSEAGTPLIAYLLDRLVAGGIRRAIVVTRAEKSDIERLLGDGGRFGVALEYLYIEPTTSSVATLDAAHRLVEGRRVALGYPDIVFRPRDAYAEVLTLHASRGADLTLGLFPSRQPERSDMVELSAAGEVERLVIKQPDRGLRHTWSIAVWEPIFTAYLHRNLARAPTPSRELYVGDLVQAALDDGLKVAARAFDDGASVDLGTPAALAAPPDWLEPPPAR